jgi:phosphoglucomutase
LDNGTWGKIIALNLDSNQILLEKPMAHDLAGKIAPQSILTNIPRLVSNYFSLHPNPKNIGELVSFGTSGHRGTSSEASFNEDHVLAVCQSIVEYRQQNGITGPLFIGKDTHALSEAAEITAIEVFAANNVEIRITDGYTPTPAISHAIINHNKFANVRKADGLVITPSHNPPQDGGIKYNPPHGGPADPEVTSVIQMRANEIIRENLKSVKRIVYEKAFKLPTTILHDYIQPYVNDLPNAINLSYIANSKIRIAVDPLGGAAIAYWDKIIEKYKLDITIVNQKIDPSFSFMPVDHDGKIRMDCSSPYAMAGLIRLKDDYDIAFGNDPDVDRHGVVTPSVGLMNPNHYLAVAIWYLFQNRPEWNSKVKVGKTLVSSSIIDRVVDLLKRELVEVPVGFKWFVDGLSTGVLGFGGEESAGASFLRMDGTVWTTDKDGLLLNLLAAEITAVTGKDPGTHYLKLAEKLGHPSYKRVDAYANMEQKKKLSNLSPEKINVKVLAGDQIISCLTRAPSNGAPIGGLKVLTRNGWFAARPSGTEEVYKLYAESFLGETHLDQIITEAKIIVDNTLNL